MTFLTSNNFCLRYKCVIYTKFIVPLFMQGEDETNMHKGTILQKDTFTRVKICLKVKTKFFIKNKITKISTHEKLSSW